MAYSRLQVTVLCPARSPFEVRKKIEEVESSCPGRIQTKGKFIAMKSH